MSSIHWGKKKQKKLGMQGSKKLQSTMGRKINQNWSRNNRGYYSSDKQEYSRYISHVQEARGESRQLIRDQEDTKQNKILPKLNFWKWNHNVCDKKNTLDETNYRQDIAEEKNSENEVTDIERI